LRLLLAEDNALTRTYMSHVLSKVGFQVQVAPDGHAAINALAGDSFDAILLDGRMPVVDGLAVVQWLRQEEKRKNRPRTPAIGLTAQVMAGSEEIFLESGFDAVLTKPVDMNRLLCLIRDLATSKKPPRQTAAPTPGGGSIRKVLAREFLKEAPGRLEGLESALSQGRLDNLADQAHSLANSAIAVGESELVEHARSLEHAAREDGAEACSEAMERLRPCLRRSQDRLTRILEEKGD